MSIRVTGCIVAALLLTLVSGPALGAPLGTAFTYQGHLDQSGSPATGTYDFRFSLYDTSAAGSPVAADQFVLSLGVTDGLFTATLDFGAAAFTGGARWLEIAVRATGDPGYTALSPRQAVTAAPYALYSLNAPAGTSQWVNDTYGIEYPSGNVGIGNAANYAARLYMDTGSLETPLWLRNNSDAKSVLYMQNLSANGYGIYDDGSSKHYFKGKVGVGITTPDAQLDVDTAGPRGVKGTAYGSTLNTGYQAGVYGVGRKALINPAPAAGVVGASVGGRGVVGVSDTDFGVSGDCTSAATYGLLGTPVEGVRGVANNASTYGGSFLNTAVGGTSLWVQQPSGGLALKVDGTASVKVLQIVGGADLAERFTSRDAAEPGTVMEIDPSQPGCLRIARGAYCRRVAGVVSGGNGLSAGVVLSDPAAASDTVPVAMSGRVWVKCDASGGAIHPGDLLTTSARPGYAMAVRDHDRAQGAILGKAMTALDSGTGSVLALISLQ